LKLGNSLKGGIIDSNYELFYLLEERSSTVKSSFGKLLTFSRSLSASMSTSKFLAFSSSFLMSLVMVGMPSSYSTSSTIS
jgi:hypothetical protein